MKTIGIVLGVIFAGLVGIAGITGLWGVGVYNKVVGGNENVDSKWSQVMNVYQRRADLIPNVVATVKGAANFEKDTLTQVAQARASVGQFKVDNSIVNDPEQFQKFQAAQGMLGQALSRIMIVQERYPELKANANFQALMVTLEGTENRIAVERREYNEAAQEFNTTIKRFPGSLIASYTGFKPKAYFQAEESAKTAPKVSFESAAAK